MDPVVPASVVVPVVDVQNDNFKELWPAMVVAMKTASFIAVDTELSGLGARKALLAEDIEDRYKAITNAARTRSILSLGLACYKKLIGKKGDTYQVQVYNLTLLCSEEYVIEPQSVQFLVQHGFDFNKQYAQGVPYLKGNDKGGPPHGTDIRNLFVELLRARKPLVLHNGLIDMVFLYQCFYAQLPEKLGNFTADLSDMFPAGIYDTKYATEYELRFQASYLEYAYKKCKLDNNKSVEAGGSGTQGAKGVFLEFIKYDGDMSSYVDYRPCLDGSSQEEGSLSVCQRFSAYGWCPNGSLCAQSHDTDLIIQRDETGKEDKRKKRKRKRQKQKSGARAEEGLTETGGAAEEVDPDECTPEKKSYMELEVKEPDQVPAQAVTAPDPKTRPLPESKLADGAAAPPPPSPDKVHRSDDNMKIDTVKAEGNGVAEPHPPTAPDATKMEAKRKKMEGGTHRAGFDAFMTGYIFSYAISLAENEGKGDAQPSLLPACLNKVYLSGKSVPLHIVKSAFSKSCKAHTHKIEMVWGKANK